MILRRNFLRDWDTGLGLGIFSANDSCHIRNSDKPRKLVPFVTAGWSSCRRAILHRYSLRIPAIARGTNLPAFRQNPPGRIVALGLLE